MKLLREAELLYKKNLAEYREAARRLTDSRKRVAGQFQEIMERQLKDLGMEKHTRFECVFSPARQQRETTAVSQWRYPRRFPYFPQRRRTAQTAAKDRVRRRNVAHYVGDEGSRSG